MSDPNVIGIDLSLTATGIAHADGTTATISTNVTGTERLVKVRDALKGVIHRYAGFAGPIIPNLVVLEGYAYGRPNQAHQVGELGGVVRVELHETGLDYADMGWAVVPPTTLKKFATGKGTADKTAMVVAARERLGWEGMDNNQADALWLRAVGLALYGVLPLQLPKTHMAALEAVEIVRWPKGLKR